MVMSASGLWVLLGYMGSGKSRVGKVLSENLGARFRDLDAAIEQVEGKSIRQIFETKGEIYFRRLEAEVLRAELRPEEGAVRVLSTGGGTPCFGDNMQEILQATPHVFYLKYGPGVLASRLIPEKALRPLIREVPDGELAEFIAKHLFERQTFYLQAPHVISCEGKTPVEIAREIAAIGSQTA